MMADPHSRSLLNFCTNPHCSKVVYFKRTTCDKCHYPTQKKYVRQDGNHPQPANPLTDRDRSIKKMESDLKKAKAQRDKEKAQANLVLPPEPPAPNAPYLPLFSHTAEGILARVGGMFDQAMTYNQTSPSLGSVGAHTPSFPFPMQGTPYQTHVSTFPFQSSTQFTSLQPQTQQFPAQASTQNTAPISLFSNVQPQTQQFPAQGVTQNTAPISLFSNVQPQMQQFPAQGVTQNAGPSSQLPNAQPQTQQIPAQGVTPKANTFSLFSNVQPQMQQVPTQGVTPKANPFSSSLFSDVQPEIPQVSTQGVKRKASSFSMLSNVQPQTQQVAAQALTHDTAYPTKSSTPSGNTIFTAKQPNNDDTINSPFNVKRSRPSSSIDIPTQPVSVNPFAAARQRLEQAQSVPTAQHHPSHDEANKLVHLDGDYDWSQYNNGYDQWCYKHNHGVLTSCMLKDTQNHAVIFRAVSLPIQISSNFVPLQKGVEPATFWAGLTHLTEFGNHLYNYVEFVPKRDALQNAILNKLKKETGTEILSNGVHNTLEASSSQLNLICDRLHYNIQQLTKHCAKLFANKILVEMHKYDLAKEWKVTNEDKDRNYQDAAICYIIGNYPRLCAKRCASQQPEHLPILGQDRSMWLQYMGHIEFMCKTFLSATDQIATKNKMVRACLEDTIYESAIDTVLYGGYTTTSALDQRETSLPRFWTEDVDAILENIEARCAKWEAS